MSDEAFLKIFKKEKIPTWSDSYLNYIMLSNKIINILQNNDKNIIDEIGIEEKEEEKDNAEIDNNNQNQLEINNKSKLNYLSNNVIKENKSKTNLIDNITDIDDFSLNSNHQNKISFLSEKEKKKYKEPTKQFISLLDKEIKKIHIFYTDKEKDLFEGINSQIRFFNNIKNKENEENIKSKIQIISDLKYLSKLGKSLINYIYLNIRALKNILNIYDNKIMFISYRYMKKHLSKNNGDLVYILNFKILDESLIAINDLFILVKDNLKKTKYNEHVNKDNDDINFYIKTTDKIYEKIFEELLDWEKYLNMSLGLPSSSYNSAFTNTSFLGDSFIFNESNKAKKKSKIEFQKKLIKFKIDKINIDKDNKKDDLIKINEDKDKDYAININEDNKNNKDNELFIKDDNDKNEKEKNESNEENDNNILKDNKLLDSNTFKSSGLFRKSDINSFSTKKVLSSENLNNLRILLVLEFFYSFSISYLIPKIIKYIYLTINKKNVYLYGVIISIISIGNLFSKIIFQNCLNDSFKIILILSLFFMILYYILLTLGIFYEKLILIIIGRFFLGFTILKHLSKIYVNQYIPISNQIGVNKIQKKYIILGFSFGILLNSFDIFQWKNKVEFYIFDIEFDFLKSVIILCLLISSVLFIIIICNFKEPTKYSLLHQLLIDLNQRHRLSKAFLVQNKEKKNTDILEHNYSEINDTSFSNQTNALDQLVQTHIYTSNYYREIKFILFILLISAEYTRENLLLFIPRLLSYNIENDNDCIIISIPIIYAICFLCSYLLQYYNLAHKKKKKRNLIIIQFFLFILNICFFRIISGKELINNDYIDLIIIPESGVFFMILLNELNHAFIINLFIKLLPSEEIKFCCFKISFAINFFTKIIKMVPTLIICLFFILEKDYLDFNEKFLLQKDYSKNFFCNYILLGIQIFLQLFCFIICICKRTSLKRSFRNRILSLKKKKIRKKIK